MNNLFIGRLIREMRREREITMVDFAKKLTYLNQHYPELRVAIKRYHFLFLLKYVENLIYH